MQYFIFGFDFDIIWGTFILELVDAMGDFDDRANDIIMNQIGKNK